MEKQNLGTVIIVRSLDTGKVTADYLTLVCVQTKLKEINDADKWYVDSRARNHMTNRREWFVNYEIFNEKLPVRMGTYYCS